MSTLRLQQLLATLDFLPVSFTPADPASVAPDEAATAQLGSFAWRWTTMPGSFMALWSPGEPNVITQGAVMTFESQQHMTTDGIAGPKVWQALLQAAAAEPGRQLRALRLGGRDRVAPRARRRLARRADRLHDPGQHRHRGGADRAGHVARLRPLPSPPRCGAPTPTAASTTTPACPG